MDVRSGERVEMEMEMGGEETVVDEDGKTEPGSTLEEGGRLDFLGPTQGKR